VGDASFPSAYVSARRDAFFSRVKPMLGGFAGLFGQGAILAMATIVLSIGWVPYVWLFAVCMVVLGLFNGALQVEMNGRAHELEEDVGKTIFASCHGFYSIGILLAGASG
jgi:hypothetical protein